VKAWIIDSRYLQTGKLNSRANQHYSWHCPFTLCWLKKSLVRTRKLWEQECVFQYLYVPHTVWTSKTTKEKEKIFARFLNTKMIQSSDGKLTVPNVKRLARIPGQRHRPKTVAARTIPRWAHYKSAKLGMNGPYKSAKKVHYKSAKKLPVFLTLNYYKNIIWICSYLFPMYFERHFYTLSIKLFRIPLGNDLQLVSNMNWVHEC
jgi:hypothetical protein